MMNSDGNAMVLLAGFLGLLEFLEFLVSPVGLMAIAGFGLWGVLSLSLNGAL